MEVSVIFWRLACVLYMRHVVAPDSIDCLPRYGAVFVNARVAVFSWEPEAAEAAARSGYCLLY